MFCPSPAATRCLVPMALSSSGRNRKFPGRMIVRRMARAAEGGQRVCEPVMGHSVRHRDKGGKKTRCGATLFDTVGEAIWNSHTWIVQHHTVGEKGAKIQLFSLLVFFFLFLFLLLSKIKLFFLLSLNTALLKISAGSLFYWPSPTIFPDLCSVFTKSLLHLNFDHLTHSLKVHAALPLLSTL